MKDEQRMTLFMTSDEKLLKYRNSRTKFSNNISPDFFQDYPFNLSLKDVYFDPKFPTLTSLDAPHVITVIKGWEHKLSEFPKKFRQMTVFKHLFNKHPGSVVSVPLVMQKDTILNNDISEIDAKVIFEIHPRLNVAFALSYLKDVSIASKSDVVKFFNSFMFPFHVKKPLKHNGSGNVQIDSNLDIYFSQNMLKMLGFNQLDSSADTVPIVSFPEADFHQELEDESVVHSDMLAQMESESEIYKIYRKGIFDKPKGEVNISFSIGHQNLSKKVVFDMDVFNFRSRNTFNYDSIIRHINILLLKQFLSGIRVKTIESFGNPTADDIVDLDEFLIFLVNNRARFGFVGWGGLLTLKRKNAKLVISPFHKNLNKSMFQKIDQRIQNSTHSSLTKKACHDLFFESSLKSLQFNTTLCNLFGLKKSEDTLIMDDPADIELKNDMNYFKCLLPALEGLYENDTPFFLKMIKSQPLSGTQFHNPVLSIKTENESLFHIGRRQQYHASGNVDFTVNHPKLIFVTCNFVQHSLFGLGQERLLGFFPLNKPSNQTLCHTFKNPLVLKTDKESTFHINFYDQNMKQLKADVGTPTLLTLKKSYRTNMFPVTLISSDIINKKLFPHNKSNSFKNRLSFPLLSLNKWTVSLRTIAFPKIKNISKQLCHFSVELPDSNNVIKIEIESCYVTNVETLMSLLNQAVQEKLNIKDQSQVPNFKVKNGLVLLETNGYDCYFNGNMIKLLGMAHSFQTQIQKFDQGTNILGVSEPLLNIFQPQEIIVLSNIVEEAFYAQKRPNILRIVPVPIQDKSTGYNYIEFEELDNIPVKIDRIDEIEIKIMSRKGEFIDFVNEDDVRIQLEFNEN